MKNIIVIIATIFVIIMIFTVTRCDHICKATQLVKKAQGQKMIFDLKAQEAGAYKLQYDKAINEATTAKLAQRKYEKQATEIYSGISLNIPLGLAYAGWDDFDKGSTGVDLKAQETGAYDKLWDGFQVPTSIIIHHSATPADNDYNAVLTSINRSHAKRVHGLQPDNHLQDKYPDISYHYVIFPDGHIERTRREARIGRATKNNNDGVIHILLVGDFSKEKPTDIQYNKLNEKIKDIQSRNAIGSITGHGEEDGEHTGCPGEHFDYLRVDQIKARTPVVDEKKELKKRYSSVYVDGKPDSASDNASYAYNRCMDVIGESEGYYGCKNMVLTFNAENRSRDPAVKGKLNTNGSQDFGICQLNNTYHIDFITSDKFSSANNQIDYCIEVWIDAKKKGKMPRAGFKHRVDRGVNVSFQ